MMLRLTFVLGLVFASGACKQTDSSATSARMQGADAGVSDATNATVECGVLMFKPAGTIVLQISGNNSENNVDREIDPQDAATRNLLDEHAKQMTKVCIRGYISPESKALRVNSQASIRIDN